MDPFSGEGELLNPTTFFLRGAYPSVLSFDSGPLTPSNHLPLTILKHRARIALNQSDAVLKELGSNPTTPDEKAVRAFALYSSGKKEEGVKVVEKLVELESGNGGGENGTVLLLAGTIFAAEGRVEEAVGVLGRSEGSLEAVALTTHLHLLQNRLDLAQKEVLAARKWAQDSLLVNIAESWVNLRKGGESYQSAFYVFEEMATGTPTSARSLVQQAVSELLLGRLPEAQAVLEEGVKKAEDAGEEEGGEGSAVGLGDALANLAVLLLVAGKGREAAEVKGRLRGVERGHTLLVEEEEKSRLFDEAASKWRAKVPTAA